MIHTLYIEEDFELDAIKKEFRKKLMTGGAVIRIPAHFSEEGLERILGSLERHLDGSTPVRNSIPEEILREIIRHEAVSDSLLSRLARFEDLPNIKRELALRLSASEPSKP